MNGRQKLKGKNEMVRKDEKWYKKTGLNKYIERAEKKKKKKW